MRRCAQAGRSRMLARALSVGALSLGTLSLGALSLGTLSLGALAAAGPAAAQTVSIGNRLALTMYLPMRNKAAAEAAAVALQTPKAATYHKFISAADFAKRYGASDAELAYVENQLESLGFTIQYVYPNRLAVEAVSSSQVASAALGLTLKTVTIGARTGTISTTPMRIPVSLLGHVLGIGGVDTFSRLRPHHTRSAASVDPLAQMPDALKPRPPGRYLPADYERIYDVAPVRAAYDGTGSTIGIVTLNDFAEADAYDFWKGIGLKVAHGRITKVNVDGGITAPTNNADGESETDLDVEYSGAIAPGAAVRVYIAPNISNANFVNDFEAAASENLADTLSTSWGEAELDYFKDSAAHTDSRFVLTAFHDVFLEMALQGQTLFVATGDSGSFDTVDECSPFGTPSLKTPVCNHPYSIDHPAADPLVTGAGGTTLPLDLPLSNGVTLSVKQERAWSWTYIRDQFKAQGDPLPLAEVYSTGDGGGVSAYFPKPPYQQGVTGISATQPGQSFIEDTGSGPVVHVVLAAHFAGRNLPDLSTNADPETGYVYEQQGKLHGFGGGTSFVAPQLNGVNALFVQALGGRVGQLNPALYRYGALATTDIAAGNNWGYAAAVGYDDAVGMGTLDATRLLFSLLASQPRPD